LRRRFCPTAAEEDENGVPRRAKIRSSDRRERRSCSERDGEGRKGVRTGPCTTPRVEESGAQQPPAERIVVSGSGEALVNGAFDPALFLASWENKKKQKKKKKSAGIIQPQPDVDREDQQDSRIEERMAKPVGEDRGIHVLAADPDTMEREQETSVAWSESSRGHSRVAEQGCSPRNCRADVLPPSARPLAKSSVTRGRGEPGRWR